MKVLANCEQGLTAEEKAQARSNIDAQASLTAGDNIQINGSTISATDTTYTAGDHISITDNVISTTGTSNITTTTEGPDHVYTVPVDTLDINIDSLALSADSTSVGYLAPYVQPNEKRVLTMPAHGTSPSWEIATLFYPVVYQDPNVTYADVVAAVDQGYAPILVDSNGRFIANYKYYSGSIILFQGYNAQPMHMTEFWLKSDDTWESHQRDIFDTSILEVYTNDRVGSNFQQATMPNMDFSVTAYLNPGSGWKDHIGNPISGSMFDEFRSKKPELVRFDYSSDLAYVLDSAPAGTPTAVFTVRLEMYYRAAQNDPYTTVTLYWAPTVTIPFSNFTEIPVSGGTAYISESKPFNYSVTFDRQRFESIVASSNDVGFQLVGTISNITPPGTYHDLRQVAASAKWVFMDHT